MLTFITLLIMGIVILVVIAFIVLLIGGTILFVFGDIAICSLLLTSIARFFRFIFGR